MDVLDSKRKIEPNELSKFFDYFLTDSNPVCENIELF